MRPIPIILEHVAEHAALVELAGWEYRTPAEQAAYLVVEGLRRAGRLPERPYPLELCHPSMREARAADDSKGHSPQAPARDP